MRTKGYMPKTRWCRRCGGKYTKITRFAKYCDGCKRNNQ